MSDQPPCIMSPAIEVVFGRWTAPILWHLRDGATLRFTDLRRVLGGVTPKVLTQRLRQLEVDGLITRAYYAEVPPRVEYSGTALADSLQPVFEALTDWSIRHLDEVMRARAAKAA